MGNLLFCLRLGQDNKGDVSDPIAVLVMENFTVSKDDMEVLNYYKSKLETRLGSIL